jgi:glycosyltransferase involved in cell wall biosynthesis
VFAVPRAYTAAFRLKHMFVLSRLARRAKLILTVSRFSQAELARYLHAPIGRFQVIPLGADHLDRVSADDSILRRHGLARDGYLLLVASLSPRKNIQAVLEAVRLTRREVKIVIAGAPTDRRIFRSTRWKGLDAGAMVLGYLQDSELKALYQNALGFVYPSTYEGFGLPLLEAMRCGCPVLASTAAALPEVAGQAALYFDPLEARSAASAIQTLIDDPRLRDDMLRRGAQRAALFTWDETARRTLEAIASVPEA